MKLFLDEMWSADIAEQLRRRGHDVVAVTELPNLRGLRDAELFAIAQTEGRAIVTENVSDFRPLAAHALQQGRPHFGLVFTTNRSFPRHDPRTIGRLIAALHDLLSLGPDSSNLEHWLS